MERWFQICNFLRNMAKCAAVPAGFPTGALKNCSQEWRQESGARRHAAVGWRWVTYK
jgi:hypothetical protein